MRTMIKEKDLIALKSIIAYTTGLEVKVLPEKEVREGYYRYLCDRTSRADEKIIRDYCFCKACEICQELDIPMQVHTAFGDSPLCADRLRKERTMQKQTQNFRWRVTHKAYGTVEVEGIDRLRAIIAAAMTWKQRWTIIARACETEKLGPA